MDKDPTNKFERIGNNIVKKMMGLKLIDKPRAERLTSRYTVAPRIYGLRKTHKNTCKLRPVVSCINSPSYKFNEDIQFTLEIEQNNRISFLDILIERREGCLITDWFIKPISSGRMLNFESNHPRAQKIGMITGLLDRMIKLSNEAHWEKNYKIISNLLLKNGYNKSFINAIVGKFRQEL
ncbi:uncharacterized protein LOC123667071 isoform X2 [Melitaea cinxia]|uniref:uncharacterized protein LOC123667071 isoform X2 n=1 Tax=Melitaea cinxia TaxID=113334 RepID=UPI001E27450B|nr:uncharacterized protein LOC123667071 isoform X2 [Melitaea cinxia]